MEELGYTDDPGWFVDTRLGRVILSLLAAGAVYFLVVWNLPDSELRDQLRPGLATPIRTAGIAQDWGVFAPNPVSTSYRVVADIEFADGSSERYEFPGGDPWIGAYREFRWRKYQSRVRRDENRPRWKPTTDWIEAQYADGSVETISLVMRSKPVPEPGKNEVTEWEEEELFVARYEPDESDDADTEASG